MKITLKLPAASVACVLGCASFLTSGTASALSCGGNFIQAPRDGQTNVPTNTLIWAHGRFGGASRARLIGPGGEVPITERFVPVAIGGAQATNFPVLIPERALEPRARYSIESYDSGELEGNVTESVTFETGSGPSEVAPPLPELMSTQAGASYGWLGDLQRFVSLEFTHAGILIGDTSGTLGDVTGVEDLLLPPGASFEGLAVSAASDVVRWATTGSLLAVGLGDCLIWPESANDRQLARFGVLDLAGNFSGWIDAEIELLPLAEADALAVAARAAAEADTLQQPPATGISTRGAHTGCALSFMQAPARPAGAALGLAALLAAARRRRGQRA